MAENEEGLLLPLLSFLLLAVLLHRFSLCQHWHLRAGPSSLAWQETTAATRAPRVTSWVSSRDDPASSTASAKKEVMLHKQEHGGEGVGMEGGANSPFQRLWNFSSPQPFGKLYSQGRPKQQCLVSLELWEHTSSQGAWVERIELDILGNVFYFITDTGYMLRKE